MRDFENPTDYYSHRPLKAIRAKCLDCSNGQPAEVRRCPCEDCPLYPLRFGRYPKTDTGINPEEDFTGDADDPEAATDTRFSEAHGS